MKILYLTNIPSPYRVEYFNELGKHCELTVIFDREGDGERSDSWKQPDFRTFTGIILRKAVLQIDSEVSDERHLRKFFDVEVPMEEVTPYLRDRSFDQIIVSNFYERMVMNSCLYMQRKHIPYAIESDGAFPDYEKGLRHQIKNLLKRMLISRACCYYSTSDLLDEYFLQYGAKQNQLYRYPFGSFHEDQIPERIATKQERNALKAELGILEEKVIFSVGNFFPRKGMDLLLLAVSQLRDECGNVGLYIAGADPTEEILTLCRKLGLEGCVHFIGFHPTEELRRYYRAAEVFALATRKDIWGLVIGEAMSCGLPVVTTDRCIAGVELLREENGKGCGTLVPVEDVTGLKNALANLLTHEDLRSRYAENALEKSRGYTYEAMVRVKLEQLKEMKA